MPIPSLHSFRRAFALVSLRAAASDVYSLQELMGHADLSVLRRYLAQYDEEDLQRAHERTVPWINCSGVKNMVFGVKPWRCAGGRFMTPPCSRRNVCGLSQYPGSMRVECGGISIRLL